MSKPVDPNPNPIRIDRFFAGPGSRGDQWRNLVEMAEAWSNDPDKRTKIESALAELAATEEFHAYPGIRLMAALRDYLTANDADATTAPARRITRALLTRSFRQNAGDWEADEDADGMAPDVLPPALGRAESRRPYFEVLIVTGAPPTRWQR
jgi:arginine decarboxylase